MKVRRRCQMKNTRIKTWERSPEQIRPLDINYRTAQEATNIK